MVASLGRILSQTVIYGGSLMLIRLLNYLLVPFYTRILPDPQQYGLLSELYSYAALLNILYLYGMETTYFRHAMQEKEQEKALFGQLLGWILLSSLFFSGLLYLLSEPLARVLQYPAGTSELLQLLGGILIVDAVVALPFARLRLQQRAWRFASLRLLSVFLTVGLNIFFLWVCPEAINGRWGVVLQRAVAQFYVEESALRYILLANLFSNAIWIPLLYKHLRLVRFCRTKLRKLLKYGGTLMVASLVGMSVEMLPRVLFRHLHPQSAKVALEQFGSYAACAKLAVILVFFTQAFRYAAEPFMISKSHQSTRRQLAQVTRFFILMGLWVIVSVSLYVPALADVFLQSKRYHQALDVVPVLLFGYLCIGLHYNFGAWYKRLERTDYGLYMALFGLFVALFMSVFFVPHWGYMGMALGLLAAYVSMAALCYFWGQRLYYVPYHLKRLAWPASTGVALVLFASPVFNWTQVPRTATGTTALLWAAYTLLCSIIFKKEVTFNKKDGKPKLRQTN